MKTGRRLLACALAALILGTCVPALGETIADRLPAGDKPVLRQLNLNIAQDYNTYPVTPAIEAYTGYKVEYDMLPADNAHDKLNLIIASQEPYDIVVAGSVDVVMTYAKAGALTDIAPWLRYAPKLDAAINGYERKTFTLDGGLYAIGMQTPAFGGAGGTVDNTVFFRQDYLDALGLAMPTTTEELAETLRALKAFDNGLGSETIPLTLGGTNIVLSTLVGAFGIPNEWNEVDGQLVHRVTQPGMKEYLAYLKALYQEGLLDVEFPANRSSNVFEKFSTGQAASAYLSCYNYQNFGDSMKELQPGAVISYLPPISGPNGDIGLGAVAGGMDRIAFIPASCENIEHVINFMELKLEPEAFEDITIGQEGVHYTVDESGERWPILPIFTNERGSAVNYYTGRPAELYAEYWTLRVKKRADIWDAWSALNLSPAFTGPRVISEVGYAPSFESSSYRASLGELFNTQCVKIIAGTLAVDSYDAFVQEWLKAGGQELTDDHNAWWAEYKAQ